MQRYEDIQELLSEVSEYVTKLELSYAVATKDENIKAVSRPLIKSSLEHLRSALEYCAIDIYEKKIGGNKRIYFPYGENLKKFQASISNNLPRIDKISPSVYKLIFDIQPFNCGDDWLTSLCEHTNFNKHNGLTRPDRINSPSNVTTVGRLAKVSHGGTIIISNCCIDGIPIGHEKPLVLNTERSIKEIKAELPNVITVTREFDWVEFRFPGTIVDTLKLIKKSHVNISDFMSLLSSELL